MRGARRKFVKQEVTGTKLPSGTFKDATCLQVLEARELSLFLASKSLYNVS